MSAASPSDAEACCVDGIIEALLALPTAGDGPSPPLPREALLYLIDRATHALMDSPPLLDLAPPVKIVGDLLGSFADLRRVLAVGGDPQTTQYLFLGNAINRGRRGIEVLCLLLAYKVKYPASFHLLRGHQDTVHMARIYGFYDEVKRRINVKTFKALGAVLGCLPIAAVVGGVIFCVHGGPSASLHSLEQIRRFRRPCVTPDDVAWVADLLWSDPDDTSSGYTASDRGCGHHYGPDAVAAFLDRHGLSLMCRGHSFLSGKGHRLQAAGRVVSLFSASAHACDIGDPDYPPGIMAVDETLTCSFPVPGSQ